MTRDETGNTEVVIPEMASPGTLSTVTIRNVAKDHLAAWDATQRLMAIHESGHCCAGAALGMKVRSVDITSRHGGWTEIAGPMDDTTLPWETSARMLDKIVVSMAGAAAERLILGEHTSGVEADYDKAVAETMAWLRAGFGGPGILVGEGGLGFGYLTEEIKSATIHKVQEVVSDAQARADVLIADHQSAVMTVATAIYDRRRLSDRELEAVLVDAGLVPASRP